MLDVFGVVTVGMALGLAYVLSSRLRRLLSPLSGLVAALRPLLIPLLVLLAASTVNEPPVVQWLAAVLLIPLVHALVVRPETAGADDQLGKWWHAIENGAWNAVLRLGLLATVAVLVMWAAISLAGGGVLRGQGGFPAACLVVALVALGASVAARLAAYGSTAPRVAVSVLLGLTCIAGLMFLGVLPGHDQAAAAIKYLAIATAVALAGAIFAERHSDAPTGPRKKLEGAGLSLAMVAGVSLVGATATSLWLLSRPDHTPLQPDAGAHATLYTKNDRSLAYRYAPVLAFTEDQKWTPSAADDYARGADISGPGGRPAKYGETACLSIGPPACMRMTIHCPNAAAECAGTQEHHAGEHISDGVVYARTVRRPPKTDLSDGAAARRGLFRPVTPDTRPIQTFIQYWLFYRYDEWTTKILGGRLTQRHEADWEAVTVGFDADEKPLFVAYSAHCGGRWRRWNATRHFKTHPLVAVANGSQANYPDTAGHRPPDWTSCQRLPRGIGALLSYAANVRDRTSDDWQWGAEQVTPVDEKRLPMSFHASWGGNDVTEFENFHRFTTKSGGGPKSPPLQQLWQQPIRTIFSDRYWDGP